MEAEKNLIRVRDTAEITIMQECLAMIKHLSARGEKIPVEAEVLLDCESEIEGLRNLDQLCESGELNRTQLLELHFILSSKISPARPQTIKLLYDETKHASFFHFLGSVGLVRRLMAASLISLALFIVISISPMVNAASVKEGVLKSEGLKLLLNLMFFLSAAGLGASFSNLFEANKYIINNTYDPKYEPAYWIRFVLGLIAGLMMAVLIPIDTTGDTEMITVPLLAMLGGFSASLVYRILDRFVKTLGTMIQGDNETKYEAKMIEYKNLATQETQNSKNKNLAHLLMLQAKLNENNDEELKRYLKKIIADISPEAGKIE